LTQRLAGLQLTEVSEVMVEGSDHAISPEFYYLLNSSYRRLVGSPLAPAGSDASWLYYDAPFAVVAHNTDPDPRFVYANNTAQKCFEYSWDEFTSLRSRFSAEAPNRAERQALLDAVTRDGFATGYRGVRIAKSGRRFWIEQGTVWQLVDDEGQWRGQAAVFLSWKDA
jgi:MEKHLA domain